MLNLIAQFDGNLGTIKGPVEALQPVASDPCVNSAATILEKILSNTIGTLTVIGGLAFLLFFVFGAVQWIVAGGEEGKIDQAKKQMTNGAIGLVIVIVSYAVIGVVGSVVGLNILNPAQEILKLGPTDNCDVTAPPKNQPINGAPAKPGNPIN